MFSRQTFFGKVSKIGRKGNYVLASKNNGPIKYLGLRLKNKFSINFEFECMKVHRNPSSKTIHSVF